MEVDASPEDDSVAAVVNVVQVLSVAARDEERAEYIMVIFRFGFEGMVMERAF